MGVIVLSLVLSSRAVTKTCTATTAVALQKCIDTGATSVSSPKNDSLFVKFTGTSKTKLTIQAKKNVWVIGDTDKAEASRPSISYSDADQSLWTSATYDLSGAVLVDSCRFVTLAGINISGGTKAGGLPFEATYASGYKNWKGTNALSIRRSYGVRAVRCTFKNAWRGILIRGENLGGASAYPNPQDPDSLVRQNLPTSNAGLYGRHVVEKCRFYDNSWGIVGDRDWDIGSIFRFDEFFDNYVRAADLATDPWNQAGGAFFTDDVAITPYRIHNNTFYRNGVTFGGYYKVGTQHLFYDNLVGRPFRYYASGYNYGSAGYTQTERQTDIFQYFAEHQRSNIVEPQDSAFTSGSVTQLTGGGPGNFRIFRQKMSRHWKDGNANTDWRANARSYEYWDGDTVSLTWYAKEGVTSTAAAASGGPIQRIRQNMWIESYRDPFDYATVATKGSAFAVPFIPKQISAFVKTGASNDVFRDVSTFDLWWTPSIPFTSPSLTGTSRTETFLQPMSTSAFVTNRIASKGWRNYSTYGGTAPDIGALGVSGGYSLGTLPQLELQDTLVEVVSNDTIQFSLNAFGWNGLDPAKLKNLRVVDTLSKFYRSIPVADTFYNASDRGCTGNQCTQVNSILDSMPWPAAVKLKSLPWVNDSLAKGLRSDRYLYAGIFDGGALGASTNYARAEVVLAGECDGKTIYSNPGVFIYARPKYNMIVNVLKSDCKTLLPLASDNISRKVRAGDSVCLQVKPNIDTTITLNFKPLFSDYSSLMGGDTTKMRLYRTNGLDTVKPGFNYDFLDGNSVLDKDQTLDMGVQFRQAAAGRLAMRALFNVVAGVKIRDIRYIMGNSPRLLVVPNTIYQATIDTIIYGGDTTIPDLNWKLNHTTRPTTDSTNVTEIPRRNAMKATVVIHLRDAFGNIMSDSVGVARARGLKIRVNSTTSMLLFDSTSANGGKTDSLFDIPDGARLVFEGLYPTSTSQAGAFLPLVSSVVGDTSAAFANDTSWIHISAPDKRLVWTDSSGKELFSYTAPVGKRIPVRLQAWSKNELVASFTDSAIIAYPKNVRVFASLLDTTPLTKVQLSGGTSTVVYIRGLDSVETVDTLTALISGDADFSERTLLLAGFVYPNPVKAVYSGVCGKPSWLRITFDSTVDFRDNGALPDSLQALFPGLVLRSSVSVVAQQESLSVDRKSLTLYWDSTAAPGTQNHFVFYNPLVQRYVPRTLPALVDSVPPVLLSVNVIQSYYKDATGFVPKDSLIAYFSGPVDVSAYVIGAALPFSILRAGGQVPLDKGTVLVQAPTLVDPAKNGYAFVFVGEEGQIVFGDTLLVPAHNRFLGRSGDTASNGCKTPGTTVTGRASPKDALIIDHDGDGNGDTVYIWFQSPLMVYPEVIHLRWGTPAETLTVTKAMLVAAGVRVTDGSGAGDSLIAIALPSAFNVAKGATWIHERTAGPADTAYFNSGAVKVQIRDGIGPVASSAQLVFGQSFDTLVVTLSEDVAGSKLGDSANAVFQIGKLFPWGSVVVGVEGNIVRIAIPSGTNPLAAGDSLRVKPKKSGGVATDKSLLANGAGDLNPWIPVKAGIRPPINGWYLDTNGDGRVETALLRFVQNPRGVCSSYSFHWPTLDSTRTPVTTVCRLDLNSKDSLLWRVSFVPFTYGATGSSVATTLALGQQNATANDPTSYRFFMYDSVGPVLLDSAYLKDNANTASIPDTLRIVPSETVLAATVGNGTARLIVQFKRGNAIVTDSLVKIQALNCPDVSHCLLTIAVSSSYRPAPGDSVRLSVKDSVFDATISRNAPGVNNPFQMIHGKPRPPYMSAYFDRDNDGRIDSVALAFTVAPAVGTVIEVGDPSGATSDVRRYTVTAADAGKTSIAFNIDPWGANVTSVSTSTIARLIDPATKDSTRFSLADSVAPVILSATISYTSDRTGNTPDTLRITSSELVKYDASQGFSFYYKPNGQDTVIAFKLDVVSMTFDSLTGQWTILVKPLGGNHPVAQDSLRFAPGNAVVDASGNHVGTEAKYTQIVELRPRILVPLVKVETPITNPSGPSSAPFQMLVSSQQGSTTSWMPMNSKNFVGNAGNPKQGHVVISFSSNMPSQMHVYVYDHLGVYVNDFALNITKEFLASAPQNKMGEVVLGIAWDGTSASGTLVNNGVYMVRLVTQRDMTSYETNTLGKHASELENEIVKVGIAR